jgi:thiamine-phosphate pyrophosphorylase
VKRPAISGVYAVTPDSNDTDRLVQRVEQCLLGGVRLLQYRNKTGSASMRAEQATLLAALCRRHGVVYIVNDDVELAERVDADGVHIGRDDAMIESARSRLGPKRLIGASCYNELARAYSAVEAGADYVAFGSMFPSLVKPNAVRASLQLLTEAMRTLRVPVVAIGGISAANAAKVIAAGADAVAVIGGLFEQTSIEGAARELCALFEPAHVRF